MQIHPDTLIMAANVLPAIFGEKAMSNIFNLSKIVQLVRARRPACVLVVDTNVLMREPDPSRWDVKVGPALFILSDVTILELEHIRRKPESAQKNPSREKASEAIRSLTKLLAKGSIADGIPIDPGWVIGVPSPRQDELDSELRRLEDIVKAFGASDTKLLLLTKECSLELPSIPVILMTGEYNLFNVAQMNGILCHLCAGFPLEGLQAAVETSKFKSVKWEHVLEEIQDDSRHKWPSVDLTLVRKGFAPFWYDPGSTSLIIAEGRGVLHDGSKDRPFLWMVPYFPIVATLTTEEYLREERQGNPDLWAQVDFLDAQAVDQRTYDAICHRLLECTSGISVNGDPPTLQDPESVWTEIYRSLPESNEDASGESGESTLSEQSESTTNHILMWFEDGREINQTDLANLIILAMRNYWKIGQTYRFSIKVDSSEQAEQ